MDISKLEVGMVVKNYKELCELVGEKPKGGKSKKYQMIDFERYFSWEKEGNKFIITEIHESVLEKTTKRGGNNVLPFIDEMELLLLDMIIKQPNDIYIASKSKMMLDLYMVNPNYHKYFIDRDVLSELIGLDISYVVDFYDTTSSTFKSAIDTVTGRLESKRLVIHEQVLMITCLEDEEVIEEDGTVGVIKKEVHREATQEEREKILVIERNILKHKYGMNSVQDVYRNNKVSKYYEDVSTALMVDLGIVSAYKAERYTYNLDELIEQKVMLMNKYQIEELATTINSKVMGRIHDNSMKRYEKALETLANENHIKVNKKQRVYDDYVENINLVSNVTIDKDNHDCLEVAPIESQFLDDILRC